MLRGDILKSKKNKRIIFITVILVIVSIIGLITNRNPSIAETALKDTVSTIEYYVIKAPVNYISNLFNEYISLKNVYTENQKLKEQLDKTVRNQATNDVLSEELNSLKEITQIDYLPTDYNLKYAAVISRDAQNWSSQISIDLGNTSGIKKDMAVVSSKGMIGIVSNVGTTSSTVTLLSSEKSTSQLPVMILSGDDKYYGLLDNYDIDTKSYRIKLLSDVKEIKTDAKVVTSGLGGEGKCPKGILLGTVQKYSVKEDAIESVCYVTPSADFDDLSYIAVVQRVN